MSIKSSVNVLVVFFFTCLLLIFLAFVQTNTVLIFGIVFALLFITHLISYKIVFESDFVHFSSVFMSKKIYFHQLIRLKKSKFRGQESLEIQYVEARAEMTFSVSTTEFTNLFLLETALSNKIPKAAQLNSR